MRGALLVLTALCAALWVAADGRCEDDRPWERPGNKAGEEILGPDDWKMVWVPPGEFTTGMATMATTPLDSQVILQNCHDATGQAIFVSAATQSARHHVRLTTGFWLGKYEVTNKQYLNYCAETGVQYRPNPVIGPPNRWPGLCPAS